VTRKALSEEEHRSVQQERLIAAMSENRATQAVEEKKRSLAETSCQTCGWVHDGQFARIVIPGQPPLMLPGILPDLVACVHAAHQKGFARLSTKDEDLVSKCGGYGNPCKAFYDRGQNAAYKVLFDTRWGSIALRGFSRKKS
jgi:hypothetical protein